MKIGRLRGAVGATAALAVVAMLALLFHAFATGRNAPTTGTPHGPSGPSVHGTWETIPGLTLTTTQQGPSSIPAVAPSDPNTVYEATLAPYMVRRTTDAGATWTSLNVPGKTDVQVAGSTSGVEDVQVFVSPLDAKSVFLTLTFALPPSSLASACPTLADLQSQATAASAGPSTAPLAMTLPRSGSIPCSLQYHSGDGGGSWKLLTLPVRAALANLAPIYAAPPVNILRAQGSRLYAAAGCGPLCQGPGDDILTSTDGGTTWAVADHDIRAAGYYVCDFTAAPSGSDVYAFASKESCGNESVPPIYLWHSGDAGAHWTLVGQPPANVSFGMAVVAQPGGASLLYAHLPRAAAQPHTIQMTNDATSLKVSSDGGKTWQAAPAGGALDNAQPSGPLAVLGDGTIVEAFANMGAATLYGWKQGDAAWHVVAPVLQGQVSQLLVVPQGGAERLIAITAGYTGGKGQNTATYTIQSYTS